MLVKRLFAILALFVGLNACTDDLRLNDVSPTDLGTLQHAIRSGSPADDQTFGAVVALAAIVNDKRVQYCTGTLIEPDVVLTAAHCVDSTPQFPFDDYFDMGIIHVLTGDDVLEQTPDETLDLADYRIYPGFTWSQSGRDIAMLKLTKPSNKTPIAVVPRDFKPLADQPITFVGYGDTETGTAGKRLQTEGRITEYCPLTSKGSCDFRLPNGSTATFPPGTLLHDVEKSGPCTGDSGGPAFVQIDGINYHAGIVSFGDDKCSNYAISTSVLDRLDWLDTAFDADDSNDNCSTTLRNPEAPRWSLIVLLAGMACLRLKRSGQNRRRVSANSR